MNINKDNYQAYILDYYEGNLSKEQAAGLMSFFEKNPELQKDFDDFEIININKDIEDITYKGKGFLKKPLPEYKLPITEENFELFCIAETEGLLEEKEKKALELFASKNPECKRNRKIYSSAKAKPDTSIVFDNKKVLKKQPVMKTAVTKIDESNYEEFFCAYIDDELTQSQKAEVTDYIRKNPSQEKEFEQWKFLQLEPDLSISYPSKSSLKRHKVFFGKQVWHSISAAAVVLIIASLFFVIDLTPDLQEYFVETLNEELPSTEPKDEKADIIHSDEHLYLADRSEEPIAKSTGKPITKPIFEPERKDIVKSEPFTASAIEPLLASGLKFSDSRTPDVTLLKDRSPERLTIEHEPVSPVVTAATSSQDDNYTTLPQLAMSEIQKRAGLEDRIADERPSIWDFAGRALASISKITGNNLAVNKERDERSGRITYLAIGDSFEISRGNTETQD